MRTRVEMRLKRRSCNLGSVLELRSYTSTLSIRTRVETLDLMLDSTERVWGKLGLSPTLARILQHFMSLECVRRKLKDLPDL